MSTEGSFSMQTTRTPPTEHAAFEAICEQVQDYETLPTVKSTPPDMATAIVLFIGSGTGGVSGRELS